MYVCVDIVVMSLLYVCSAMPHCYDPLLEPTVFEVEAYNPAQCPRDDLWPCDVPNRDRPGQIVHWDRL